LAGRSRQIKRLLLLPDGRINSSHNLQRVPVLWWR
jgi:hypothetical protein